MTDTNDLAARLYGHQPTPAPTKAPAAPTAAPNAATPPERPQEPEQAPLADRLYDGGPVADSPAVYDGAALAAGFDAMEHAARYDGDTETVEMLSEARQQAAALMHELAVPLPEAKDLTVTLSRYVQRPLDDDALAVKNEQCAAELRSEWGKDYEANLATARRGYAYALKKMPSLANIVEAGAGSDPKLLRVMLQAGKRLGGGRR